MPKKSSQPAYLKPATPTLATFLQGTALGIAEIIPGVSGSTIAVLFGIYDDFIELLYKASEVAKVILLLLVGKKSIGDVVEAFRAIRWKFGLLLGTGMIASVIALSTVIISLLSSFPVMVYAFLLGLTFPTMWLVWQQIEEKSKEVWIVLVATVIVFLSLFVATAQTGAVTNPHPAHLFVGGMVAVSTMILPGVSGSFMLLILGLYNFVVNLISELATGAISSADLLNIGYLAAGMITGFLTTVRVVRYAFNNFKNILMAILLGLLTSSWYVLWPFVEIIGFDSHSEPILAKVWVTNVSPLQFIVTSAVIIITALSVTLLQKLADNS